MKNKKLLKRLRKDLQTEWELPENKVAMQFFILNFTFEEMKEILMATGIDMSKRIRIENAYRDINNGTLKNVYNWNNGEINKLSVQKILNKL